MCGKKPCWGLAYLRSIFLRLLSITHLTYFISPFSQCFFLKFFEEVHPLSCFFLSSFFLLQNGSAASTYRLWWGYLADLHISTENHSLHFSMPSMLVCVSYL